jgi:exopolysaccharide biosynthesis protein
MNAMSLVENSNAVVAMNGDCWGSREKHGMGYIVRQGILYQNNLGDAHDVAAALMDVLLVNEDGDFITVKNPTKGTIPGKVNGKRILNAFSFGPVLVEDGVLQECDWYPAGEVNTGYSRAGIGQYDKLHYYYMSLNHSPERAARWTVNQFGHEMYNKGLKSAYCLDGGQTSEIVFQGEPYNYIDFGAERGVSDILYFATAIPESEVKP